MTVPSRIAALAAAGLAACTTPTSPADVPGRSVTVFAGNLLDNHWEEVFVDPGGLQFENSYLAGVAASARVAEPVEGLTLEVEGQVVRHVHGQTHWEFNAPILTARWSRLPWSETLDSSVAFGIGLSLATETPALEVANEGDSSKAMVYWMIEVESETPVENWRLVGRLHHRSPAYGLFGDDGGSNALVLGLRRRF